MDVPLCRSRHGSYTFPVLVLSRPACLSVHWPQNCFYKCRSRCSIALQPNRITRLFSYSREVERRERLVLPLLRIKSLPLVQQQRQRQMGHFSCPSCLSLSTPHLFCSYSLSYIIFPLCPDSTEPHAVYPPPPSPPPLNKYTSVAWALANVGCLATEFSIPHLRWASLLLVGLSKAIYNLASPACCCGLPECQWGFSTNTWLSWLYQRARLSSVETDAFFSKMKRMRLCNDILYLISFVCLY